MTTPQTRYAETPDGVQVAFQVWGDGDVDLIAGRDATVPIDMMWDEPRLALMLERLGRFARNVWYDGRGVGSSDAIALPSAPSLDGWMDDHSGVMAAVGSSRGVALGMGEAGTTSMLYAATHPERVSGLILFNSFARLVKGPDYPYGLNAEVAESFINAVAGAWGTMTQIEWSAPSMVSDAGWCRWLMRASRLSASPREAASFFRAITNAHLHRVLGSIQAPTLIVHRRGNRHVPVEHGRYLAERIPGAIYRELGGDDHLYFAGNTEELVDEIEEFVTGVRPAPLKDRVLATIMFTDIVDSSRRATELGDSAWRRLLDAHDATVRTHLQAFRGREVKTTGDGFLATFDGPGRAIRCALALVASLRVQGLDIRSGVHTGEVELRGDDIGGISVHTAARVAAAADGGEVLVSSTVKDLVAGSDIAFEDRDLHDLKGIPGPWRLFRAMNA